MDVLEQQLNQLALMTVLCLEFYKKQANYDQYNN